LLDPVQVVSQGFTFLAAGYETTSTAVGYTIALLSRHSAIETRLLDEIDGHAGQSLTFETMSQWPYAMV
jgi:cytochrome P450 family 4